MKFGFRTPSLKKRISARTSWKRYARHSLGLKAPRGTGIITNPKKALYNKAYNKTTFGIGDIFKTKSGKSQKRNTINTSFGSNRNKILDRHFQLFEEIEKYYRRRDENGMLDKAIRACEESIELAPLAAKEFLSEWREQSLPAHTAYTQLAIIYQKQGKLAEAIKICEQARDQGWNGDWDKRIASYQKKLNK